MPQFKNWLYLTQHGRFCRMCRQHKPPVKKGFLRAFIEVGILVFRKDYIERHISSEPHQYSVKHQVSLASGYSVMQAFETTVIMEHEAVIGGFKCLYWLLKVDQRNNYQSHRIVDEMLEILAQIVELPILQAIRSSQAISLEVDETTDVSVSRQLDLHVRHLDKEGCVFNHFLDLSVLQKKELPVDKLYGLGTDGAAVMTGRLNGVAKQLTDSFPQLVSVANSANRSATLRSAATTLGLNDLKVKEVKDTRWLSQDQAVQNLQRNLPAVLAALAEEASTRKCPVAKGAGASHTCYSGENSGGRRDPTPRNVPCSPTPRPGQPRWTWGL
ncbi:hypothetical protein KUCAC02_029027 [Chaenocephalus aceratus]|uniref:Uncharacterized protein n=1 Tax=Chaenocephalus aceratus TaxID=36190 RepID=A0ACB9X5E8_CHAAC|nr:hypothetical protein KUCAC02_029027 [Chaenocephalus aceratus]